MFSHIAVFYSKTQGFRVQCVLAQCAKTSVLFPLDPEFCDPSPAGGGLQHRLLAKEPRQEPLHGYAAT